MQNRDVIGLGQGEQSLLVTAAGWENLVKKAGALLSDYHQKFPTRTGMPRVELGSRLKLGTYASAVLQRLAEHGQIAEAGASIHMPAHQVKLSQAQQVKVNAFLQSLTQNAYAPPTDLIPEADLLNLLIEQHKVVKVSDGVVFAASTYDEMVERVIQHIKTNGKASLAEVRDMFQTSRKYAQAILEHLDGGKITRRVGDERVLY